MISELTGPLAALTAGLVTSLHCAGMCGPLACAACGSSCARNIWLYHAGRLVSYSLAGALAGLLGARILAPFLGGATRSLAWIFALFFLAVALGFDKRLRLPLVPGFLKKLFGFQPGGAARRSALLGLATPLLPCAPLYLVLAAAAFAGSWSGGALLLAAFAAGTMPLLFVLQNRMGWLQQRLSPRTLDWTRRGLAAAGVVVLVARGTFHGGCLMCQ